MSSGNRSQSSSYSGRVSGAHEPAWTPTSYQLTSYLSQSAYQDGPIYGRFQQPQDRDRSDFYERRATSAIDKFNAKYTR